jgi:methionyl-tRNA formyltransferase
MRLVFMGTPEFAVPSLERLIRDGHDVAAVFTQPDKPAGRGNKLHAPPVKALAAKHGIPVHQPLKIKTNEEVRRAVQGAAPDACIVAAYGKILPGWLLAIPRLGCINVHSSLLPKYRGAAPVNWAIANGERETGVTIMQMDEGMDTGPIWAAREVDIGPEETAPHLLVRLAGIGADLLSQTLPLVQSGQVSPTSQADSEATYAPILKREDGLIDFRNLARRISDRLRGFQPWPGGYTSFRGARLIIWKAHPALPESSKEQDGDSGEPAFGSIVSVDKSGFFVACGKATELHVDELQIEGKGKVAARDFINGMRLDVGDMITDRSRES